MKPEWRRIKATGRLFYVTKRQNCGIDSWLLSGWAGGPYPIHVLECDTEPAEGVPAELTLRLVVDNEAEHV